MAPVETSEIRHCRGGGCICDSRKLGYWELTNLRFYRLQSSSLGRFQKQALLRSSEISDALQPPPGHDYLQKDLSSHSLRHIPVPQEAMAASPPIYRLPTEMLLEIYNYLSSADQGCFTLSSKIFYTILGKKSFEGLRFPRERLPCCYDKCESIKCCNPERWAFLEALERDSQRKRPEDSAALCSQCFVLHSATQFSTGQLSMPAQERMCFPWLVRFMQR